MINILTLLEMVDFQPCEDDEYNLHNYLNYELNGIEYEDKFRVPKYFKNLCKYIKSIL
jgi:hypothetical protein